VVAERLIATMRDELDRVKIIVYGIAAGDGGG
jgi:hypothetical protein